MKKSVVNQTLVMEKFIEQIDSVIDRLSAIESKYDFILSEKYQGNSFSGQINFAAAMENLIHHITHEVVDEIVYLKEDILLLHNYIKFRKKYSRFSNDELAYIIDSTGDSEIRKHLLDKIALQQWNETKRIVNYDWHSAFGDVAYDREYSKIHKLLVKYSSPLE